MSAHRFPGLSPNRSAAACANGCGTLARQDRLPWGAVGLVEYLIGFERTGSRPGDVVGVWTTVEPPCGGAS